MACSKMVGRYPLSTMGEQLGAGLPSSEPALDDLVAAGSDLRCLLMRKRSYSLTARRSISREMTSKTTPMQEPAKTPFDVIFQDEARKHESMVFQFQSICSWLVLGQAVNHKVEQPTEILQPFPLPIPPILLAPVAAAAGAAVVVVPMVIPPWSMPSMLTLDTGCGSNVVVSRIKRNKCVWCD